jgi:hypothetical protein
MTHFIYESSVVLNDEMNVLWWIRREIKGSVFLTERLKAQGWDCELSLCSIPRSKWVIRVNVLINPLNAELNPICNLLILLRDLTFTGTCIVSIFQYISNKMQRYTVYLYLETALHVSGGTCTHHQEHMQLYLQHLVFITPLLLSAAISWNRFECAAVGVSHPQHTQTSFNSSTIAAVNSNGVKNTRCLDTVVCAPDDGWKYHL